MHGSTDPGGDSRQEQSSTAPSTTASTPGSTPAPGAQPTRGWSASADRTEPATDPGGADGRSAAGSRSRPDEPDLATLKFLTVSEVARLMRVSPMTVYRMIHSGELPALRVKRSYRVPERAVHAYLQAAFHDAG
jgi:excisionase family DNA binding protein